MKWGVRNKQRLEREAARFKSKSKDRLNDNKRLNEEVKDVNARIKSGNSRIESRYVDEQGVTRYKYSDDRDELRTAKSNILENKRRAKAYEARANLAMKRAKGTKLSAQDRQLKMKIYNAEMDKAKLAGITGAVLFVGGKLVAGPIWTVPGLILHICRRKSNIY